MKSFSTCIMSILLGFIFLCLFWPLSHIMLLLISSGDLGSVTHQSTSFGVTNGELDDSTSEHGGIFSAAIQFLQKFLGNHIVIFFWGLGIWPCHVHVINEYPLQTHSVPLLSAKAGTSRPQACVIYLSRRKKNFLPRCGGQIQKALGY